MHQATWVTLLEVSLEANKRLFRTALWFEVEDLG
jgi:hypothetical protein